ncbi:2-oxo acid dehydrogenase subunit E2 [Bacillus sp. HMF5848]|uniref:dihydrolipoamide acetyltransferase family protein n=1 Tax=Bacillus sp. HMF5848 TaxID=2495421 RepID=UPI000F777791|nr:dihydrolipoamide acetyltransferase family protein [Bacillus sp. HMF5848]RSK27775.1 2-oxo acid dehydrogenase subunit E2 [Bacillus sp. HMF5848]
MAIEQIKMPQLGESVTEGTISKWLVSIGDKVNKYDPLLEVMTDKVNAEVPSSFTGTVKELLAEEGDTLAVGGVICTVETADSNAPVKNETTAPQIKAESSNASEAPTDTSQKQRYSPAVLRLAQEHDIELQAVSGTGAGGRITRKDILKLVESGNIPKASETVTAQATAPAPAPTADEQAISSQTQQKQAPVVTSAPGDREVSVTPVRKAIASNMLRSVQEIPHAWTMVEADVSNLVTLRDSIKTEFKQSEGYNITYFAFFVKAIAQALKEYPQINSMWAGDKIVQKKDINISIAVATDDALYVPVIRHADEKSIKGIAREINELAMKVRSGKLSGEDMKDGTFTVNNTGSFGSVQSMGIINYPQAAILQVESIVKRVVVMDNGMMAIRDMVNLCLSLDHRVLDGLVCGRFLARVKEILENMSKDTTSIY